MANIERWSGGFSPFDIRYSHRSMESRRDLKTNCRDSVGRVAIRVLAFFALLGVVGCSIESQPDTTRGPSEVVMVTEASFAAEVEGAKESLVLVDLWAEWCGPCKMIAPALEKIASEYAGRVKVCKVDIDSNAGLARRFNANAIPLVLLFENGRKVDQKLGAFPEKTYREWVEANL